MSIPHSRLTIPAALEAFDRWDPVAKRAGGPAYGKVVLYAAGEIGFEELVRAVLLDQGLDPDHWQRHVSVVCRAFEEWMRLDAPYVAGDEFKGTA